MAQCFRVSHLDPSWTGTWR